MTAIDGWVERLVGGWGEVLAREFMTYDRELRARSRYPPGAWGEPRRGPYWREMPLWLARRVVEGGVAPLPEEFMGSALRGQICLFYAIRIQDDILDGTVGRSPLALAPVLFMNESARVFASTFGAGTEFWHHYREGIEATARGIALVAGMQRDPVADPDRLLELYGMVDSVLAVGSVAVCERSGRREWIPRIKTFVSEVGKVLLVLDDLDDIEEDLGDGRITYPVRALLANAMAARPDLRTLSNTWKMQADPAGFRHLRGVLGQALQGASSAIEPVGLKEAVELIERLERAVQELGDSM